MTRSEAKSAMFQVLLAAWQALGLDPDRMLWPAFDNAAPTGTTPWARVTTRHTDAPVRAHGDGKPLYENKGVLFVQVFTTAGQGENEGDNIAQSLVDALRDARLDVWFRNVRAKEVDASGGFAQVNVISDFTYD